MSRATSKSTNPARLTTGSRPCATQSRNCVSDKNCPHQKPKTPTFKRRTTVVSHRTRRKRKETTTPKRSVANTAAVRIQPRAGVR